MNKQTFLKLGSGAAAISVAFLVWHFWQLSLTKVYLPDGSVLTIAEESITNSQWQIYHPPVFTNPPTLRSFLFRITTKLVRGNNTTPCPPRMIALDGNIAYAAKLSQKTFLVERELLIPGAGYWLAYRYGVHTQANSGASKRSDGRLVLDDGPWLQANLDGIRTNGVYVVTQDNQILSTNSCAIVVSPKTVRIMPARYFKSAR